ncbi:MAG: hypothetical protein KGM44_04520, partial [bacterium]|nr:hypothetical protein [bacterium]
DRLLHVETRYAVSRGSVRIHLLEHPARLHLVLQDSQGTPVGAKDISPNEATVDFTLPAVATDETFVLVAGFQQGTGEQTVLQPLIVHAR